MLLPGALDELTLQVDSEVVNEDTGEESPPAVVVEPPAK